MQIEDWLLTAEERGNPDTVIDRRRGDGAAWTAGNAVTPLPHGRTYFAELLRCVDAATRGDIILFTDWRGDPDETLDDSGRSISSVLCRAAGRGVVVKGLVWRSHLDVLAFSGSENRRLGDEVEAAGGECLLDMRVRPGGSHHQKIVVIRHANRPADDVAFVGGIDLCHSRRDDARHGGDDQAQTMPDVYGDTPPWHDIQLAVRGPAVGDVEASFRERWYDPSMLSHNPVRIAASLIEHDDEKADPLPPQTPDPPASGSLAVQILRTYPYRVRGYPFAKRGERSIARAYQKALGQARSLVYLEDQYLWSAEVAEVFAAALRREPGLRMIAVVPLHPDTTGLTGTGELLAREVAMRLLTEAGGDRVNVYGLENHAGTPVYVHAKICVVDDVWTCVGSDNLNRRSWTHDSELSCAVMDAGCGTGFGRGLRLALNREHLDRADGDDADLVTPADLAAAYATCARDLEKWHADPAASPRPAGRLREFGSPPIGRFRRLLARPVSRVVCDPDGRPPGMRRRGEF